MPQESMRRVAPWSEVLADRKIVSGAGLPTRIVIESPTGDSWQTVEHREEGAEFPIKTDAELLAAIRALYVVFQEVEPSVPDTDRLSQFIPFLEKLVSPAPVPQEAKSPK